MDKFSKTTEIDISDAMGMEDDTPKKSVKWKVVAIVMSVLIAICIWLYVMQTDTALYDREYKNISVTVVNADGYDVVVSDTVTVKLRGTKSNLADIKKADITVRADASSVNSEGEIELTVECILTDKCVATVEGLSSNTVKATSTKK